MSFLKTILKKHNIEIIPVKVMENRIVFYVRNGKDLLRKTYGSNDKQGLFSLVFDGIPLTKFHGDEHFCPTCEKMISAGYGLDKCDDTTLVDMTDALNSPFENIQKSFEDLKPLLGLLPTGYYLLSDEELYPTDGNGAFFWSVNNTPKLNPATCPIYDSGTFDWSKAIPKYLVPTQSPKLFNQDRVDFYRDKSGLRIVSYYLEGYICALLDGHHKATAAALSGKPINALVITSAYSLTLPNKANKTKGSINFGDIQIFEDELLCSFDSIRNSFGGRMTENEMNKYLGNIESAFDTYVWSQGILDTADSFYDAYSIACIEWAGDLSDTRLENIMNGVEVCDEAKLGHIIRALFVQNHDHCLDFAFFVCKNEANARIWHNAFKLLAKVKDKRVEDFFVDYLVNDEKIRPDITKIVNDYFIDMRGNISC